MSVTLVRFSHDNPSGLVMTPYLEDEYATATNSCAPAGPPHVTNRHMLSHADVWFVHVIPGGTRVGVTDTVRDEVGEMLVDGLRDIVIN